MQLPLLKVLQICRTMCARLARQLFLEPHESLKNIMPGLLLGLGMRHGYKKQFITGP